MHQEHPHHEHHRHISLAVFASMAITAIIVGVLVYAYQEKSLDRRIAETERQLALAGDIVKDLQNEKQEAEEKIQEVSDALVDLSKESSAPEKTVDLPRIVYERPGLLSESDKKLLEERLIGPYTTYYNMKESDDPLVAMIIEVPQQKGQEYVVSGIHKATNGGFLFGKRDASIEWWRPSCLDICAYPPTFRTKYPHLVEE